MFNQHPITIDVSEPQRDEPLEVKYPGTAQLMGLIDVMVRHEYPNVTRSLEADIQEMMRLKASDTLIVARVGHAFYTWMVQNPDKVTVILSDNMLIWFAK